jgi:tRNA A-37 threonylcarbamoyl transferase component Bud32
VKELTCLVKYSPVSKVRAVTVCSVWCVGVIAAAVTVVPMLGIKILLFKLILWLLGGFSFIYVPYTVVSAYTEGGLLVVTSDGITFPPGLWGLGPRLSLRWKDLRMIDFDQRSRRLILRTANRGTFDISTTKIPQAEAEQLLFAMEVWNPSLVWSQAAADYKDEVQNAKLGLDDVFTRSWETELKRRYAVTTFAPHQPGTTLQSGRLKVLKQLAFGGFSAIYLAEDENRQRVVIKELVPNRQSDSGQTKALEMFDREAKLLSRIAHPQIARVLDSFVENDRHYLVLEFVDGENLRELVNRKGRLNEELLVSYAKQMLLILDYLHRMQPPVVHRDFTPDNLIVTASGSLTLVDFGAANDFVSTATGTLVGKQSYMPIEQIRGKAEPRSDLYALGCTLSFLLTGKDPEPLTTAEVPTASLQIKEVIRKLTAFEASDRYTTTDDVLNALPGQHFTVNK